MPACCPPASPETLQHGNLHGKLVHLQDILTYLWECFRNPLHIHPTTHLSVTTGNFLQGIPNRLISIFPILCPFLSCFGQERTETLSFLLLFFSPFFVFKWLQTHFLVSTLFFKPFELMLLLCLTLGLLRGAMFSTWPLELVTLQCVMLPYALHVFQD